jgi:thiol:disulfide interchange protein DsbG
LQLHRLFSPSLLLLALALGACSPQDAAKVAPPAQVKRDISLEAAAEAKGFAVGALMSAHTVYVFFDAQCPHCGHLWNAALPLQRKVKFVWVPVGLINATSTTQGAALLAAVDPAAQMDLHEASLLAGKGGISASSSIPSEIAQAIQGNTRLLNSFGAEGVPFVVARNTKTGQTVSKEGALSTAALADFLGVEAP